MLNDYKRNFILSNMLLTGTTLFLILAAVFAYSCHMRISDLKTTMAQLTEPFENGPNHLEAPADAPETKPDPRPSPKTPQQEASAPPAKDSRKYQNSISVFFYHTDTEEISYLSNYLITDETIIQSIVKKIASSQKTFGKLSKEHLYFYKKPAQKIIKIALTDIRMIRHPALEMLFVLLAVFFCTMLLFYFISRHLAKLAVRPLDASLRLEKQFITDASHDLKTPIAVILANTSILKRNPAASISDLMQWVNGTETAAKSMQSLIEEMLMLSTLEAAEHTITMEMINISDAAENISLLLEPIAYEKQIIFYTDITEDICIQAKEDYIKRIFQSLIENAIKYEPNGGSITISLSLQQKKAVFLVNNKMATIEPKDLPFIFDKFYRSDKARQSNGGHGLGLAIVKNMTALMNGTIEAESSKETGTTFRVTFKL